MKSKDEVIQTLLPWVLSNGYAHHSLAQLAEPLGLTRGALCHYFKTSSLSIKEQMALEILENVRRQRREIVLTPLELFSGTITSKRNIFAQQLYVFFLRFYEQQDFSEWICPVARIESEFKYLIEFEEDSEYKKILNDLWDLSINKLKINNQNLIHFLSGPFPVQKIAFLDFFRKII